MGDIYQGVFGGSKSHQSNVSQQSSNSNSASGNYALNYLMQMLGPAVNYAPAGGDVLGSLLGVRGYADRPVGTPQPTPVPVPDIKPPVLPPALKHVDLKHDGINGNAKTAKKQGKPIDYWVDAYGNIATPPKG